MALDHDALTRLGLNDFIAIDLETTGLNAYTDEIIEFGAVHFVNGVVEESVSQLIQPNQLLPEMITRITGITQEDVAYAPKAEDVLPELLEKWTDGTLVAHNLDFELGFLNGACEKFSVSGINKSDGIDTLLLARTLVPKLFNHKLETVASYFEIPLHQAHRAREDAEVAGKILLALMEAALEKDARILEILGRLAPKGTMGRLIKGAEESVSTKPSTDLYQDLEEYTWTPLALDLDDIPLTALNVKNVSAELSDGGTLAQSLPQFEEREEQQALTREVAEALNEATFLIGEAGTGVGKSFAYLVPAMKWSQLNDGPQGRVVLSTRTKTLQDQLFQKDIPLLQETFEKPWRVALLKGRQNYLCLRRVDGLLRSDMPRHEQIGLMPLVAWLGETKTGDLDEAHGFWRRDLKRRVYDDPEYCVGRRCEFYERCFSINARQEAKSAQLVVVNHALLLADLALDGGILGDYRHLILDEAHHLETSTRQALQRSANDWQFKTLFEELLRPGETGRDHGLLAQLQQQVPAENADLYNKIMAAAEACLPLRDAVYAIFNELTTHVHALEPYAAKSIYTLKKRYQTDVFNIFKEPVDELVKALSAWTDDLESISELTEGQGDKIENLGDAVQSAAKNFRQLCDTLRWLVHAQDDAYVFWYELSQRQFATLNLSAVPLDVGEPLMLLYERLRTAILTSATLSVGEDFSYFLNRVGLDRLPSDQVKALNFGQPFEHDEVVHLSVPTYLPDPNDPAFAAGLADLLYEVTTYTQKHTMALFTSYKLLQTVQEHLAGKELFVCAQNENESRSRVLEEFRNGPKAALLLGTDSFWEGIDLRGDALEILVITKIPFPVPSDPLVSAEEERLSELGKSAFGEYSLPQAILTLRQGFGRLIRSKTDRGAVIITDARIMRKGYGKRVLGSLPCEAKSYYTPSNLLLDLKNFFDPQNE